MAPAQPELVELQDEWKNLFQKRLPAAAQSKDDAQGNWPVHVDHCFARIILDKVVGGGSEPWLGKLKTPAYRNMTHKQLEDCIELGERILNGDADLVDLNESSLVSRGKAVKEGKAVDKRKRNDSGKIGPNKKPRQVIKEEDEGDSTSRDHSNEQEEKINAKEDTECSSEGEQEKNKDNPSSTGIAEKERRESSISKYFSKPSTQGKKTHSSKAANEKAAKPDISSLVMKIESSSKTAFQKKVLALLLQIPPGQYSTYGQLSSHLDSSPRAVGNALRNNPFAPEVPCHRVLATGGGIGGFGGSWGKGGKPGDNDSEKKRLLNAEGVRFDGKGKAIGKPWDGFT